MTNSFCTHFNKYQIRFVMGWSRDFYLMKFVVSILNWTIVLSSTSKLNVLFFEKFFYLFIMFDYGKLNSFIFSWSLWSKTINSCLVPSTTLWPVQSSFFEFSLRWWKNYLSLLWNPFQTFLRYLGERPLLSEPRLLCKNSSQ